MHFDHKLLVSLLFCLLSHFITFLSLQLRETIYNFCQKELAPYADEIDKQNNFAQLRVRHTC